MSSDEFFKLYNKEIYEKIQVAQDNPKDYTAKTFIQKRDTVVNILNQAAFASTKDEKAELDKKLRDVMSEPICDVNGNEMRRVKRVGEDASIEVRGGLAYTAPSLVCMRCSFVDDKKLQLQRVDIRSYIKEKIAKHNQIDIFNNDLVEIFIEKLKILESKTIGLLKGFTESKGGRVNLRHPKYPLLKEKQPLTYQNEFSIGSTCGIKKYKTDATGKVLGFYYLGRVLNNGKELFAKVLSYKAL
jgi:hypothetical protein